MKEIHFSHGTLFNAPENKYEAIYIITGGAACDNADAM